MADFERKGFYGTVILKEFIRGQDGRSYDQLMGTISILTDKEIVGFEVNDRDSKWVARIEGPSSAFVILGCQVRGVVVHGKQPPAMPYTLVVP
jgi:hypothetical protein